MMKYYPILRGRQNELIALRELAESKLLDHVIPVIEPVKATSSLTITLRSITGAGYQMMLIVNPHVGNYLNDAKRDEAYDGTVHTLID